MLEDTRLYLERVLPWIEGAYGNLHFLVPNRAYDPNAPEGRQNQKNFVNGYAYGSVDDMLNAINYRLMQPETLDMYVCMSAQTQAVEAAGRYGGNYMRAVRAASNVAGIKALWIDVDVKPDNAKAYPTRAEAQAELVRFLKEAGLPVPTLVVSSGTGGMHTYWVLDRTISREEWQPLADALAEATRRYGFKCDTQCTVNGAQLLRPPQTWNCKADPKLPVVLGGHRQRADISVEHMRKVLTPYMGARVLTMPGVTLPTTLGNLQGAARPGAAQAANELGAGIQTSAPPVDISNVIGHCGFVRDGLVTGGRDYDQPLWNLSTLLSTFVADGTHDGRKVAHDLARGHAGYTQETTDALYDRKVLERQARNIGWPSCASIANAGCQACGSCQYKPLNKSPLSFAKGLATNVVTHPAIAPHANVAGGTPNAALPAQATPPSQQPMPQGYVVDPHGVVSRVIPNPDGSHEMRPVCAYPLTRPWVQSYPWAINFTTQMAGTGKPMPITVPLLNLQSRDYAKYIANQGIVLTRNQIPELQEFLVSWVQTLQAISGSVVSSVPSGWSKKNGKIEGFAYAGQIWTAGQPLPAATLNPVLADQYTPRGDLAVWQKAADFITGQNRPDLAAIVAAAIGAPLVEFTGHEGAVISAWSSGSGIGKTTAAKIGQGAWGHPTRGMNALDDTANSAINKAGQLQNMPLIWDELKGEEQKIAYAKLLFKFTRGIEKNRLGADSTQREAGYWTTNIISCSNESIMEAVEEQHRGTEAGIMRVFEFEVKPSIVPSTVPQGYVSRLTADLKENYGMAGLEFAKFLGANHARVRKEVAEMQDWLEKRLGVTNEERYWLVSITCTVMGAKYANELALTKFNVSDLLRFLVETLHTLRKYRKATSVDMSRPDAVMDIINRFLSEMAARHTLVTDRVPLTRGKPSDCKTLNDTSRLEHIVVRHAVDQQLLLIARAPFQNWLKKSSQPVQGTVKAMERQFHMISSVRMMGSGTKWNHEAFKQNVFEIDYSGTNFDFAKGQ